MAIFYRLLTFGASGVILATAAQAQGDVNQCRAITNPAGRLACYDRASGTAPAAAPPPAAMPDPAPTGNAMPMAPRRAPPPPAYAAPAPTAPASPAASSPAASSYATLRKRSNFDAVVLKIEPLAHGLFRLNLADGTAYDTSMEGAHIAPGTTVHIRRSALGTTFVDLPGQAPIPVRLVRQE